MADKAISDLIQALQITGEDFFVLEQNGEAKKLKGETLLKFITLNVVSVTVTTLPAGSSATATYDKSNNTLALGIPQGKKGDTGATGATGPANVLTIGSVTSGKVASATITGEAPNQVLNLVLEKGEKGLEGPVGGSSNFVRYDAAQTLTDAQMTQARTNIGAAPDGFGLGKGIAHEVVPDCNDVKLSGLYIMSSNTTNYPTLIPNGQYSLLRVSARTADEILQEVFCIGIDGQNDFSAVRSYGNTGGWSPWEYVNPPMKLGVEYRTTERYLGKPVYVRTVQAFSSLTGSDVPDVCEVPVDNADKCISCTGETSANWSLPSDVIGGNNDHIYIGAYVFDANTIKIYARTNRSGWPTAIRVTIKYTKTTE